MRQTGAVQNLQGLARRDHVCWAYGEVAEYTAAARQFLLDGLEQGERLLCVGEVAIRSATEGADALPEAAELVRTGRLDLVPLGEADLAGGRRSLREQLQFYSKAVDQALADGYAGLRVAAEVTELAGEREHWSAQVEWERAADRFIVSGPGMTTLCAYRVDLVAEALLTQLLEVHPLAGGAPPRAEFRLFHDDEALVLAGDLDGFVADRLAALLDSAPQDGPVVTLDVAGVTFVDGAATAVIASWVATLAARGIQVRLRGAGRMLRRVWAVLGYREPVFD